MYLTGLSLHSFIDLMRVVHITTVDIGGAYKAVQRINESLLQNGVDSSILLRTKSDFGNPGVVALKGFFANLLSKAKNVINLLFTRGEFQADILGTDLSHNEAVRSADVIVLHWINSFLSPRQIIRLKKTGKPIVWVMHDMWPCTGGCHYDDYCGRYTEGCGCCPLLGSKRERDMSRSSIEKKKKASSGICFVGVSRWSAEVAASSYITKDDSNPAKPNGNWIGKRIAWIHNPVDRAVYYPKTQLKKKDNADRIAFLEKYGIGPEKALILYGAARAIRNKTKGADDIEKIFTDEDRGKYQLIVFGNDANESLQDLPVSTTYLGHIRSEEELARVYNLCDVFLTPARQESFGYTVAEALACGTPVVGYAVGGIQEQVIHKRNGYLAQLGNHSDLRSGIEYCLNNQMEFPDNGNGLKEIGEKYLAVFQRVLQNTGD